MKIMLDNSVNKIEYLINKHNIDILQLRTPLTQYRAGDIYYGLDNGAYSGFNSPAFYRMAKTAMEDRYCLWIAMPDVPMCAYSTDALFRSWSHRIRSKRAYVIQNGQEWHPLPWDLLDAVFVGGDDNFKMGPVAFEIATEAKNRGKMVHVGRINTPQRADHWYSIADTIDGSGLSRFDGTLNAMIDYLKVNRGLKQERLLNES